METNGGALIRFRLDPRSGVPAYRQLVDQVRQAVSLGILCPGDKLPPVREVVRQITINPNTVHRAYRDLEAEGLVRGEQGRGTFVLDGVSPSTTPKRRSELQRELGAWMARARRAGLDDDGILALVATAMNTGPPDNDKGER
ncbi:MAG: transcriptional regulator, GntR family [Acidimicrobiaceae bacterium]|jgi:GntR family transcriptional regulator|nr:transcriptional regulator, GntR family [Acidimicrobiaceae bacterium]